MSNGQIFMTFIGILGVFVGFVTIVAAFMWIEDNHPVAAGVIAILALAAVFTFFVWRIKTDHADRLRRAHQVGEQTREECLRYVHEHGVFTSDESRKVWENYCG